MIKEFAIWDKGHNSYDDNFFKTLEISPPNKFKGYVVALVSNGKNQISLGLSFCSRLDEWDENKGKKIALERACGNCSYGEKEYIALKEKKCLTAS